MGIILSALGIVIAILVWLFPPEPLRKWLRFSRKGQRRAVGDALINACRTALQELEGTITSANFHVLFKGTNDKDFEALLDEWTRVEKDDKAKLIRNRYQDLAARFSNEEIGRVISEAFRHDARKEITDWKSYFEQRST